MPESFACRAVLAIVTALVFATGPAPAQDDAPVVARHRPAVRSRGDRRRLRGRDGHASAAFVGLDRKFARQIRQGAPFQIFMAADERFIFDLHRDGFTRDEGDLYAVGRIVVKAPPGSTFSADGTLGSLRQALAEGRITRFAIANPDHAPYGRRAMEALQHAGLWEDIQPFLVLGENVSQAAQFALSGTAEGAIIALSLALAPQVRGLGTSDLIPEDFHEPLRQRMALLNGAGPVAEAFTTTISAR